MLFSAILKGIYALFFNNTITLQNISMLFSSLQIGTDV